jgi:hypothetical protein
MNHAPKNHGRREKAKRDFCETGTPSIARREAVAFFTAGRAMLGVPIVCAASFAKVSKFARHQ